VYKEWNRKAIAFVSYGSAGGARSVEQLREVAIELQMTPVRFAVHIPWQVMASMMSLPSPVPPELFEPVNGAKDTMIQQLLWWTKALKQAREEKV
jgi:NAD(P)H-dependent FMN reductase